MKITDLKPIEYGQFYSNYLGLVPKETTLLESFSQNSNYVIGFFESLPKDKLNHAYAPNKWTVIEVFQHLIDTERIFQYRCFRIARHDKTALTGFEENDYIESSQAKYKSIASLIEEFKAVRQNFIILLKSLRDEDLKYIGNANGNPLSARAAAFIVLGHSFWHINIVKERYL